MRHQQKQRCEWAGYQELGGRMLCWVHYATVRCGLATLEEVLSGTRDLRRSATSLFHGPSFRKDIPS